MALTQKPARIELTISMVAQPEEASTSLEATVTVIGGGLAGLASAIHLARAQLRVLCIEPVVEFEHMVGESLDWSAPDLLAGLGLIMDDLVQKEICTYKRHVRLEKEDGSQAEYVPSEWLRQPPFNVELRTVHVDRFRLHAELTRLANEHGVRMLHDRVSDVTRRGDRILSVQTAAGRTILSDWFVDASGFAASVLGRALRLPELAYGPRKVAFWSYLSNPQWREMTTLYAEAPQGAYMSWIWQIPVNPGTVSLGYVLPAEELKRKRSGNSSVGELYHEQLLKFKTLQSLAGESIEHTPVYATTFRCRTYRRVCGENWVIVGEAASVPDPITGNGVTAALRHAAEGTQLIAKARHRSRLPFWSRWSYNMRVRQMAKFFNSLIEKLAYDWPVRDRIGLFKAAEAYTTPAWSLNYVYSKVQPTGPVSTLLFCGLLVGFRAAVWCAYEVCKLLAVSSIKGRELVTCT